jgi:hypothetical protein
MMTTQIIIALTVLLWIAWDLYALWRYGVTSTESRVIAKWCARFPWVPLLLGYLLGHWTWPQPQP